MNHLATDTLDLEPDKGWREKIIYPVLLFGILQSLVYLILVTALAQEGLYFYFSLIVVIALAITQLRLVFDLYIPNVVVGGLVIAYFMRDLCGVSAWTDLSWLVALYDDLAKCGIGFRHGEFFRALELNSTTYIFLAMLLTWVLVYLLLTRLVKHGKILGLLLLGLAVQAFIFSYIDRRLSGVNLLFMLISLLLLSTVRLGRLQYRWNRQAAFGVEDISFGWAARSIGLIVLIVAVSALLPAFKPSLLQNNAVLVAVASRFQSNAPAPVNGPSTNEQLSESEHTPPQVLPAQNAFGWDSRRLGGTWQPVQNPVMTVNSPSSAYWRGGAKDIYTGSGWVEGNWPAAGKSELGAGAYQSIKTVRVEQTITMSSGFISSPVLFGATMPQAWQGLQSQVDRNFNDNLVARRPLTGGTIYRVTSDIPVLDDNAIEILRKSGNSYPSEITQRYLNLPSLPARVKQLAASITRDQNNPYDQAVALASFFQNEAAYKYTLDPPATPANRDFVDYFLFDSKQGYCTYFSTALAVMARSIGLPSRWVTGYATGSVSVKQPNLYRVTAADQHAWVEIYFAGVGWIPFEATKSFSMPAAILPGQQQPPGTQTNQTPVLTPRGRPMQLILLLSGSFVCIALAIVWQLKRRKDGAGVVQKYWQLRSNRQSPRRAIMGLYRSFLKLMAKNGRSRVPSQTAREFAAQQGKELGFGSEALAGLTLAFERVRYGKANPSQQDVERAKQDLAGITRQWESKYERK